MSEEFVEAARLREVEAERDALRGQVEALTDELGKARVQMARDASHMALCKDVMQGVKETRASLHLSQTANLRLRKQLDNARKEIAKLKQAAETQT